MNAVMAHIYCNFSYLKLKKGMIRQICNEEFYITLCIHNEIFCGTTDVKPFSEVTEKLSRLSLNVQTGLLFRFSI